jgi:glycosyltransferase involved in cell wall biosynthesis
MDKLTTILLISFCIAFLVQCYFWLVILKKSGNVDINAYSSAEKRAISIVVCALNEYANLKCLIPKLLQQEHDSFEVIIVNDRSTDNTNALKDQFIDHRISFLEIVITPLGFDHKKYALQEGIKRAKYDYILLTDADCTPRSSNWINEMQKNLTSKKEIVLGLSFYKRDPSLLNNFIQFETYYTAIQYLGFTQLGYPYMGVGRNLMYKKDLFTKNTEFKNVKNHIGGDDDLVLQQFMKSTNTSTCISSNGQTTSIPEKTWANWFNQKRRHLKAGQSYPKKITLRLFALQVSHTIFFFTFVISFFHVDILTITLIGYLLRTLIIFSIFDQTSKKFDIKLTKKEIIFGDFLYVIYFFITGIFTLYTKKLKWK